MFMIKMMSSRKEGYKLCGAFKTIEEVQETVKALKTYYNPIDIYYTYSK